MNETTALPNPVVSLKPAADEARPLPKPCLVERIRDAELLLEYAAAAGIDFDPQWRAAILRARAVEDQGLTTDTAATFLGAYTALSAKLSPVTAASIRASLDAGDVGRTMRAYNRAALIICPILILFSAYTFITGSLSQQIVQDIAANNTLAPKLRAELGPSAPAAPAVRAAAAPAAAPEAKDQIWYGAAGNTRGLSTADVIADLAQLAETTRRIEGTALHLRSLQFKHLLFFWRPAPTNLPDPQLQPGLELPLAEELTRQISDYQVIRGFGERIQADAELWNAAWANSVLPVLYAILGTIAYLLRAYRKQVMTRVFVADRQPVSRFLVAAIAGLAVGLFSNYTGSFSVSPFAIAFLAGYAVDVFFAALEALVSSFARTSLH